MKKYLIITFAILLSSCGGAGHIQFYNFIAPKQQVKQNILDIINSQQHKAPQHWNNYEQGADRNEDIFAYFSNGPKEIYWIGFASFDSQPTDDKTVLALIGIFDGKIWHFSRDMNRGEEYRVKARFEKEILSKVKYYYAKD